MSNHLNSDQQLDQAVKGALESYEAPFDSSAWADMEKQLAAQPKPLNPFKKFSFSLNTIIAIGVVAGGLIIYKLSANNDHTEPVNPPAVTSSQPVQASKKDPAPAVNTAPIVAQPIDTTTAQPAAPVADNTLSPPVNPQAGSNNAGTAAQNAKKKEKKKSNNQTANKNTEDGDFDFMKVADQATKSAPAFGDQIDPVRGFINPSNESANVKKEAYDKTSGWGDQVLRTMKPDTAKSKSSAPKQTPAEDDATDEGSSEKTNSKKPKSPKKTSTDTSSSSAEKTDSTSAKKVKGKNTPKYQTDKPIFEQ